MSELSHGDSLKFHRGMNLQEMRGDLAGNYLQYTGLYDGRTIPYEAFVNELWLDRVRATTFVWMGLHQVFPEDFSRDVYSYFKAAGGEEFRYEKAPWGTQFVQVNGRKKKLVYGRIHGVTEADVPVGAVAGWCMYGSDGHVAGLDPAFLHRRRKPCPSGGVVQSRAVCRRILRRGRPGRAEVRVPEGEGPGFARRG